MSGLDLVCIDGVTKRFGDKVALRDISFSVPQGQICGLLGPNGAGKTTLFRLLMGILKPTEGRLAIAGFDCFEQRVEVMRRIGFLPDEPVFYAYMTGRETLELWAGLASIFVGLAMLFAALRSPAESWRVTLVAAGWFVFARSMANKSVTLASVTSPSGEAQKIPLARRAATQLGTFTFAIGVLTQQWTVAVTGIVYSIMTAAAMWQNFRARLPFLQDPWSERLPPPPTLMHAMIAISLLVELGALTMGIAQGVAGPALGAWARAMGYGVAAALVTAGMVYFLHNRGVTLGDVWRWPGRQAFGLVLLLPIGAAIGAALGGLALLYEQIPWVADEIARQMAEQNTMPNLRQAIWVMGVLIAPVTEEYLFRGLLFRALDREWGGWRAVLGSAAFFAIYHGPLAWLPVAAVGAINALLFRRWGRLAPAVALHMAYNAVVLS